MISLEVTTEELQLLYQSLDCHLRQNGMAVDKPVADLGAKLRASVEKSKVTDKDAE